MTARKILSALMAAGLAGVVLAPSASAHDRSHPESGSAPTGTRSLAAVLTADGNQFDRNWYDYDIVTEAVLAVLANKPNSPVGPARRRLGRRSPPSSRTTAPSRSLVARPRPASGSTPRRRSSRPSPVWASTPSRAVLLYHVVPGATITAKQAAAGQRRDAHHGSGRHDRCPRPEQAAAAHPAARQGHERPQPVRQPVRAQHQQGQQADRPRHHRRAAPGRPLSHATPRTRQENTMRTTRTLAVLAVSAGLGTALAVPAHAADAKVSILHAVPGATVDVYANGDAILEDFTPGTLTDPLTLPGGHLRPQGHGGGRRCRRGRRHRGQRRRRPRRRQRHGRRAPRRGRHAGADAVRQRHLAGRRPARRASPSGTRPPHRPSTSVPTVRRRSRA